MKTILGIVILLVVCVGLVVALVAGRRNADVQRKKDSEAIVDFSNQLTTANINLDDLRQVNLVYSNDLDTSRRTLMTFSNRYVETSTSLSNTASALKTAQDQISDLEAQNRTLDQQTMEMTNTIASLTGQINDTQMKLVESETNNTFLETELKRQVAEKAELERKFNDLAQVRAQVRKLRDDLLVAQRLKWMREGTDPSQQQRKGAELLVARTSANNQSVGPTHYDLNVVVSSDGSVQVVPAATNAPPASETTPP